MLGIIHYDGYGHLVLFNKCIKCDFYYPLKYWREYFK